MSNDTETLKGTTTPARLPDNSSPDAPGSGVGVVTNALLGTQGTDPELLKIVIELHALVQQARTALDTQREVEKLLVELEYNASRLQAGSVADGGRLAINGTIAAIVEFIGEIAPAYSTEKGADLALPVKLASGALAYAFMGRDNALLLPLGIDMSEA